MAQKGLSPKQQWEGYCLQLPTDDIVVLQQEGNFKSGWADANTWKMIVPFVFEACVPCSTASPNLSLSMRELPFALVQKGKKCLLVNKLGKTVKTLPYTALRILGKTILLSRGKTLLGESLILSEMNCNLLYIRTSIISLLIWQELYLIYDGQEPKEFVIVKRIDRHTS